MTTKVAGAAGLATFVLLAVGYALIGFPPAADDPPTAIARFFAEDEATIRTGMLFVTLSFFPSVLFASALYRRLRGAEPAADPWALAGFAGWLGATAVFVVGAAIGATIVTRDMAPETVATLYGISVSLLTGAGVLTALSWVGVGVAGRRSNALPRWSSTSALVLAAVEVAAVIGLLAPGTGTVIAQAGVAGYLLWVAATGMWMLRTDRPGSVVDNPRFA